MANYYYCFDDSKNVTSYNSSIQQTVGYSYKITLGDETVTIPKEYKVNVTTLSNFLNTKTRFILGNKNFKKVEVYGQILSSSPYGTYTNFVDITNRFDITTYASSGIIDIQPNSNFTYGTGSYIEMYIAVDKDFNVGTKYTVQETLTGCTCDVANGAKYDENASFELNITCNANYTIDSLNSSIGTIVISDDKTTAKITGIATENIVVNCVATEKHKIKITGTFKNCTCNYADGETMTSDKNPITITAKEGCEFVGVFKCKTSNGISHTMSNNGDTLTYNISSTYDITLNDEYNATRKVEKISNFANLYYTNNEELEQLSKVRFVSGDNGVVDYGTFITSLFLLPFPIDTTLLSEDKSNIILGNYDSNVASTRFITYKAEVDGGTITVNEKYNNVYDFLNTDCILHLPYFNKMFLNSEYVIGHTLTIKYIIDLYTGNVTCNVYSSFIDDIIETQTQQIAENIPFIQKQNNSIVGSISNINKNTIETAFIEIVRNIPYDSENIFGKETIEYCVIGTKTGYLRCSDVVLNTTATIDEKEEIKQLLKEGVFINEH